MNHCQLSYTFSYIQHCAVMFGYMYSNFKKKKNSSPVSHMVDEVLFKHVAPLFDDVEQSTLHITAVHSQPPEEHVHRLQTLHLLVDLLIPAV